MRRREFLGAAAASAAASQLDGAVPAGEVVLVASAADPIASAGPVKWGINRLETALTAKGTTVRRVASIGMPERARLCASWQQARVLNWDRPRNAAHK